MPAKKARTRNWFIYATVFVVLGCRPTCPPVPKIDLPPLDDLPGVEFISPLDPMAHLCLTEDDMEKLLVRDVKTEGYINKLRAALEQCK